MTYDGLVTDLGLQIMSPLQKSGKDATLMKSPYNFGEIRRNEQLSQSVEQISSNAGSTRAQPSYRFRKAGRLHATPAKSELESEHGNDQFKEVLKKIKHDKIERERKQKQHFEAEVERTNKLREEQESVEKARLEKEREEKERRYNEMVAKMKEKELARQ